jgi:hypothetical protein
MGSSPNHSQIPGYQSPQSISWPPQSGRDRAAVPRTSGMGVRRAKAALSSGCKPHPANAPAGSNRSTGPIRARSVLSPTTDMRRLRQHVCQRQTSPTLFDHLVGERQQGRGYDVPRAFAVLRLMTNVNLLACSTRRLGTIQNFRGIDASMTRTVERVCSVGHQKARHVPIPRFTPTVGFPDAATKDITRGNRQKENNTTRGEPSRVANGDKRYWAYCTRRVSKSKLKLAPPRAESLLARMLPPWASTID